MAKRQLGTAPSAATDAATLGSITKTAAGLGNVDNTSDANKPLSIAALSALAGKSATGHTHSTRDITDVTSFGRSMVTAATPVAARSVMALPNTNLGAVSLYETWPITSTTAWAGWQKLASGGTTSAAGNVGVEVSNNTGYTPIRAARTDVNLRDVEAYVEFTPLANTEAYIDLALRQSLSKTGYYPDGYFVSCDTGGTVWTLGAVDTDTGQFNNVDTTVTWDTSTWAIRLQVYTNPLNVAQTIARAKVWKVSAGEPVDWVKTITDTTPRFQRSGTVALGYTSGNTTNPGMQWSNLVVTNLATIDPYATQASIDGKVNPAQLVPFRQTTNSIDAWSADKVVAQANARVNYDDAAVSNEVWGNLNNWSYTSGKIVNTNGRLYSGDTLGGSQYGAVRAAAFGAINRMVLKTTIVVPASGTESGDTIIGVTDEVAKVPTGGAARVKGITFRGSDLAIMRWNMGRDTAADATLGNYTPGSTYYVTLTVDATSVSVSVMKAGTNYTMATWIDRTGFTINSPYLFNNDQRAGSGRSIGQVGFITALSSLKTRSGLEDVWPWWPVISDNGTYRLHIALPPNYDSRKPSPVLFCFHGATTASTKFGTGNDNNTAFTNAFTAAGYIVVSASLNANLTTWGTDDGLAVYEYAYRYLKSFFSISQIVFHATSMGGIESLLTLARNKIPCTAWIGVVPTVSLRNNFEDNYASHIRPSYGIATDGSDYATKTAGHDPMLMDPGVFRGLPMMVVIATDDTSVPPARNWNLFEPKITAVIPDYLRVNITGGHVGSQQGAQASAMVAFANKYVQQPLT